MDANDVARILAKAAAFDQRTIGDGDVLAWLDAIGDLDLDDALAAVTRHYRETTDRLGPSHVRRMVEELQRERRRVERERQEAEAALTLPAAPTRNRSAEVTELVQQVVAALPVADSDRIHQRAVTQARRQRGRPENVRPERKRRKPPKEWPEPQTDEIVAMATRYLIEGYEPAAVADRLGVSRRWCQRTASKFNGSVAS